ncbi:hypothetical protein FQN54_003037 [Arachnomyces sp. PD_36]|nr:hypothetical protein FQN54_003037 [Arachnomyces sp. PD_36]
MIRHLIRIVKKYPRLFLLVIFAFFLETIVHIRSYSITRPLRPLDAPFQIGCREPDVTGPRANAAIVMLAQNRDRKEAVESIRSIERHFNRWFHYPIVFINDEPWEETFVEAVSAVASGDAIFDVIPKQKWGFPEWMDKDDARASLAAQDSTDVLHAGKESYHHMCRFYSGAFFDMEKLKPFKWFWRIEPGIKYTCSITYDPFVAMERSGKRFGYTISIWEVGKTAPGLFRAVSDYKKSLQIKSTDLWKSLIDPSWVPYPFRSLMSMISHRDASGDAWNLCHYWNNFEIADLDFFRSKEYRDFFDYLDRTGGFYYERWGDASIHSLAAALFLKPQEIHHFEDFGYSHEPFWTCPANTLGGQLPLSNTLGKLTLTPDTEGKEDGIGCRCKCPAKKPNNYNDFCTNKLSEWSRPRR